MIFHRILPALILGLAAVAWSAPGARAQEILFDGAVFRLVGWDHAGRWADLSPEDRARVFAVYVDSTDAGGAGELPAVAGTRRVEGAALVFVPRYPPAPGVRYRAVFDPGPAGLAGPPLTARFDVRRPETPPTAVEHVYPSTDVLPENQLKIYIHFSAPMARGEAYRHIRLLDDQGNPVGLAFLELDQELWTRDFRRFTILFDPGRIKTGLVPNQEIGRALVPGNTYTLVIGKGWRDANGRPLESEYRKTFRVGPFDDIAPDVSNWRVRVPSPSTTDPLAVEFPEPMDRGLLDRLIWVVDTEGRALEGRIEVDREETRWLFIPASSWQPGDYQLVAGTELEDLAGNALDGLFEVDVFEVDEAESVGATEFLHFSISAQ